MDNKRKKKKLEFFCWSFRSYMNLLWAVLAWLLLCWSAEKEGKKID